MKQPAANTAKGPNPRDLSDTQPVPESMTTGSRLESVAPYLLGHAGSRDVEVVSRLLRSLDPEEEQALVLAHKCAQADEVVLAPALAGRSGSGRRYRSWPLVVRRAQARRFNKWCMARGVDILKDRLPLWHHEGILPGQWPVARVLEHVDHAAGARAGNRTIALQRACKR
jgi:hypothetical protein